MQPLPRAAALLTALALFACDKQAPTTPSAPPTAGTAPAGTAAQAPAATPRPATSAPGPAAAVAPEVPAGSPTNPAPATAPAPSAPAAAPAPSATPPAAPPSPSAAAPPAPRPDAIPTRGPVATPTKDSPEAVVMKAIQAAMDPDEAKGWEAFAALLHSSQRLPNSLTSWRAFNFAAFRRKVHLYLADDTKPAYVIDRVDRPTQDRVKIFVHNERSMPTPCQLRKDPQAGGAWRIEICSL